MNLLNFIPDAFWAFLAGALLAPVARKIATTATRIVKAAILSSGDRVADLLKNDGLKTQIRAKMFELEKQLGSEEGKAKFEVLVAWAINIIPGPIDDAVVRQFCQAVYDEVKKPTLK